MSNQAIQTTRPATGLISSQQWGIMMQQAETLVASGFLPREINTAAKAVAVILKGRELGIPPMYALSNIAIINGKPVAGAELLLALIYRDQGNGAIRFAETSAHRCTISYARVGWTERDTFTFTIEDAKQAGIAGGANWQKYPAAMLRARAVSAVARMAFADSIGGMFTPEELDAPVTVDAETGEVRGVIEGQAREVQGVPFRREPDQRPATHGAAAAPAPAVPDARSEHAPAANGIAGRPAYQLTPDEIDRIKVAQAGTGYSDADRQTWLLREYAVLSFALLAPERREHAIRALEAEAAAVQGRAPVEVGA